MFFSDLIGQWTPMLVPPNHMTHDTPLRVYIYKTSSRAEQTKQKPRKPVGVRRTWVALVVFDPVRAIMQVVEIPTGGEHHIKAVAGEFGHLVRLRLPHVHHDVRLHVAAPTLHAHIDTRISTRVRVYYTCIIYIYIYKAVHSLLAPYLPIRSSRFGARDRARANAV